MGVVVKNKVARFFMDHGVNTRSHHESLGARTVTFVVLRLYCYTYSHERSFAA